MKKLMILISLVVCYSFISAQESVNLKFIRPSKIAGSVERIKVTINDSEYILKNGTEITATVSCDYGHSLRVDASSMGSEKTYYLKVKRGESYVFEVGFEFGGIYLKLLKGVEATEEDNTAQADTSKIDESWNTTLKVDRKDKSIGFTAEKTDETETIRKEWLARGGKIKNESVMLTGAYFSTDIKGFGTFNGHGGGFSFAQNWITLNIPDYSTGKSSWNSLNLGWGYDMLLYTMKYDMDIESVSSKISSFTMTMPISANIGWTVGLGKFLDEGNWKGVALTFKYRPSLVLNNQSSTVKTTVLGTTTKSSSTDGSVQLNAVSFGFDIDFSNFSATMDKLAPKPKSKFSFFFLPPIGDTPLFISFSFGVSFYSR
ncbi:MAG TPA: hypothetical protein PLA24_10555 [Tenuifilaceae bacterium]|nr:hypothetical protein [Tenuifilaceae bacterium]HRX30625.1 hypothetical protein [Tenuifilaceae bacterium]